MASIIKADTLQSTTSNVFVLNSAGTEYARFDSSGVFQLANPTTFPAGTAALPSITATGDTNTGIFFPAADTIAFAEGGVESVRIDSSGNVKMVAANTKILNSSGNPILQQTGSVLQVVQGTLSSPVSTTSLNTWVTTGLLASITPTSSSSKILATVSGFGYTQGNAVQMIVTLYRNSTNLSTYGFSQTYAASSATQGGITFSYLDSPATTSSTTYTVYFTVSNTAGTVQFNSLNAWGQPTATIILQEIAA